MKKTVVFDFDGTIVNTLPEVVRLLNEVLPEYNFRLITKKDIEFFKSHGMRETIKKINLPLSKIIPINARVIKEFKKRIENIELIDGIKEVLKKLKKQGFILGLLTGNSAENVKNYLKKNNLDIFDFVYSGGSLLGKHLVLKKMMKSRGLDKDDFIYIGDEVRDIEACKKVGVKIIAVDWGFNDRKVLEKYKPEWIVDKPKEILKIISGIKN